MGDDALRAVAVALAVIAALIALAVANAQCNSALAARWQQAHDALPVDVTLPPAYQAPP